MREAGHQSEKSDPHPPLLEAEKEFLPLLLLAGPGKGEFSCSSLMFTQCPLFPRRPSRVRFVRCDPSCLNHGGKRHLFSDLCLTGISVSSLSDSLFVLHVLREDNKQKV